MPRFGLTAGLVLLAIAPAAAQAANPQIDFPGYQALTKEVQSHRASRLISWEDFAQLANQPDVLILDARSAPAYEAGHIKGAVNLPLPDFTSESLLRVIGPSDRPVLIYCNNNFSNNVSPVPLKRPPLALNIQTFINLVGYGYRNVHELDDVIDFNAPDVPWVTGGTDVHPASRAIHPS